MNKILSLDTSSTNIGWALSLGRTIRKGGRISIGKFKKTSLAERCANIFSATRKLIESLSRDTKIDLVLVEEPFYHRGHKTSKATFSAYGACISAARFSVANIRDINPGKWHQLFFLGRSPGKGDQLKENVVFLVKQRIQAYRNLHDISYDEADAVGMLWSFLQDQSIAEGV